MNEAETRQKLIDMALALAGWNVNDPSQVTQELVIPVQKGSASGVADVSEPYGQHYADYALLAHGKPLAVVEAKRTSKNAQVGREQALQYAKNLQGRHGGRLPFVLYSNGYDTYLWESDVYPPVKIHGFPTRDDLEWMDERRQSRKPLSVELIDTAIAGRDYQIASIRSVLEGVEAKRRKFLLVMATGTGKTRVAAGLVDVLVRARWAKRVLFLVDRLALQTQALDAFKEFLPSSPRWPDEEGAEFGGTQRVYVTTYPTMLNLIEGGTKADTWLSPHFFDVIIADESHRSIYNTYKRVLDYFSAITIGLTATPTDRIDHDTFDLFDCPANDPTFAYTFEQAIQHAPPYLCTYRALKIQTTFQLKGIKGKQLSLALQKRLVAEGKDLDAVDFEGTDIEKTVTNSGTNVRIVREFMEECIKDPSGTLPGKSIVFAISKAHAYRLETIFNDLYPEHQGKLARVLVSDDDRVQKRGGLLDQFKNEDMPRVAISVDMLDTGVDVREVVNLIFAKPVFSFTKFWQMIGRGTRVLDTDPIRRKPWCPEKDTFLILDCWGNFDFFGMNPEGLEPPVTVPLPVRLFLARLDKLQAALASGLSPVADAVISDLRADLADLPAANVVVLEHRRELDRVRAEAFWASSGALDLPWLRTVVAPLFRTRSVADFKALGFELDVVEAGIRLLEVQAAEARAAAAPDDPDATKERARARRRFAGSRKTITRQVSELPLTVNVVATEKDLLTTVQTQHWWSTCTDDGLREAAARLAPLMRYRPSRDSAMTELNLPDATAVREVVEFGPEHERVSTSTYRERVEAYVRSLVAENPVLQKLVLGHELSPGETRALADLLAAHDPYVTEDLLRKVYDHKTARFLQFIRHILGLEPLASWTETVTTAFGRFIAEHTTLSSAQIQFLQTLQTFVLQKGQVEKQDLIDAPFTQIHPNGVRGLFAADQIDEILDFAHHLVA